MAPSVVSEVPEEILSAILASVVHGQRSPKESARLRLVSKAFYRITTPLLYHTIGIVSTNQSQKLAFTLRRNPSLRSCIRVLRVEAVGSGLKEIARSLSSLARLDTLDLKMEAYRTHSRSDIVPYPGPMQGDEALRNLNTLCQAIALIPDVTHLVVRKDSTTYTTEKGFVQLCLALASAIPRWRSLKSASFLFKLGPITPSRTGTASQVPPNFNQRPPSSMDPLAYSLSIAPSLTRIRTYTPALWNTFLLDVSSNPRLQMIELLDGNGNLPAQAVISAPLPYREVKGTRGAVGAPDHFQSSPGHLSSSPVPILRSISDSGAAHNAYRQSIPPSVPEEEDIDESLMCMSSLFFNEARKHPRLYSLIRAGRRALVYERASLSSDKISRGQLRPTVSSFNTHDTKVSRPRARTFIASSLNVT